MLFTNILIPRGGDWEPADVLVQGETFAAIDEPGSLSIRSAGPGDGRPGLLRRERTESTKVIPGLSDGRQRYLIPAGVDPHVHVREPGDDYKEDWATCSQAALKGGCCTIFDMPNNQVPVTDLKRLEEKQDIARAKSLVDFGLYMALTEENGDLLRDQELQERICGVKIYYAKTTGGILVSSDSAVMKAFEQPRPVLVHTGGAEGLENILSLYRKVREYAVSAPVLYICHVSTREEVDLVRRAKPEHPGLRVEVSPHHLYLTADEYQGPPRVLPPLASADDRDALWEGVSDGTIDTLGTDHAPHTLEEKNSSRPPAGFPGLETALPLLFDTCLTGGIPLPRFIDMTSGASAALFGLPARQIREGAQASFTVMEEDVWRVGEDGYASRCGWSPFHGRQLRCRTVLTVNRGRICYQSGQYFESTIQYVCSP
jgi:dihydroorotase-like cyclic amidohydrolase